MSEIQSPPNPTITDRIHTAVRAGLGSIPYLGNAAVELFQSIIVPPLEKRQQEWMESVRQGLLELQQKYQVKLEDLTNNELFVDTVMQASQAAIRSSQQIKREALRNAVLNSALAMASDANEKQIFVNLVDSFTEWHLRILDLVDDPVKWFERSGKQPPVTQEARILILIVSAFPELSERLEICELIAADFYNRRMTRVSTFIETLVEHSPYDRDKNLGPTFGPPTPGASIHVGRIKIMDRWTTEFGRRFLQFIKSPLSS